jgi:hypothetical protein
MLADELIEVHEKPRQVAPFSERYAALTPAQGYQAALALHRHRLRRGMAAGRPELSGLPLPGLNPVQIRWSS